jgi:hypothetical protein
MPSWRDMPRADHQGVGMPPGCRTPRDWRRANRDVASGSTDLIGVRKITRKSEEARIAKGLAPGVYYAFVQETSINSITNATEHHTKVLGFFPDEAAAAELADAHRPPHQRNCRTPTGCPVGYARADNPHYVWSASPHAGRAVSNRVWQDNSEGPSRRSNVDFRARQAMVWAHRLHCKSCQATRSIAATDVCYMAFLLHIFVFGFEPIMVQNRWPAPVVSDNRASLLRSEIKAKLLAAWLKAALFPCLTFTRGVPLVVHPWHPVIKPADRRLAQPPVRICTDATASGINEATVPWVVKLMDKRAVMLHLKPLCIFAKVDFVKWYWQIPVSDFFAQCTGHKMPPELRADLLHLLQQESSFFADWQVENIINAVMSGLSFGMKTGSSVASLASSEFCVAAQTIANNLSPLRIVKAWNSAYVDDILAVTDDQDADLAMLDYRVLRTLAVMTQLRLHNDNEKDFPPILEDGSPRRRITHDGVVFDSVNCTVSIDEPKRARVLNALANARRPSVTKGELFRLVGLLEHLEVVVRGSAILNNFIWYQLYIGGPPLDGNDSRPARVLPGSHCHVALDEWHTILSDPVFSWSNSWLDCEPVNARVFNTDAAGNVSDRHRSAGWAAFVGPTMVYERWTPEELLITDMSLKEGRPLLWFCNKLGPQLTGKIVVHLLDNSGFSFDVNKQRTISPARFALLLSLSRLQRRFNFELVSHWFSRNDPRIEWADNGTRA